MSSCTGSDNLTFARSLFATWKACGLGCVVLAPGARCAPLVLAARENDLQVVRIDDERSAGFVALGWARVEGRPAAIVTTSGSAVANLLPSVVEARQSGIPMLLVTADRPVRLRGTGANQTGDQVAMLSGSVNRSLVADASTHASGLALDAWRSAERGVVHVNIGFDEPLLPSPIPEVSALELPRRRTVLDTAPGVGTQQVAQRLMEENQGVVFVGPLARPRDRRAARALVQALGWPVLADIASGVRDIESTLPWGGWLDGEPPIRCPVLLHLGGRPTSRSTSAFLARNSANRLLVPGEHGRVEGDDEPALVLETTLEHLSMAVTGLDAQAKVLPADIESFCSTVQAARQTALEECGFSEPWIAAQVGSVTPSTSRLLVGNSRSVRELDRWTTQVVADVHASRGLSGIDGQISTAFGLGLDGRPVVALLGDQTIRHDLSGLAQLAETNLPVVVVAVDNGGGQIFRDLPFASDVPLDDFVSPRSTDLGAVATALGYRTVVAEDRGSFAQGLAALAAIGEPGFLHAKLAPESEQLRRAANQMVSSACRVS
ncbi:MAG: 2-succinyl-5-enolpyruvyl-6-hydroxy-3-cyclohexene-1-carboxylic-acid synthase [Phycisphaerae bacterium]|nr:2-succinyl-5-enolpyruvyl-6-hydroxy-3-cyclohexene-1-carboxylic-acid synthase [Phycisphaerae bacterium]